MILHPSKVQKGKQKTRWQDVFKVWRREIPKPDFAMEHAAKAIRLLPKCNFSGLPSEADGGHPVLNALLERTKDLLAAQNASAAQHDVPPVTQSPQRGRRARKGLCSEDVAAMIRAAAVLKKEIPQLQRELLPLLLAKVPQAISVMAAEDVAKLMLAAWDLRDSAPELRNLIPWHLGAAMANEVATQDLVNMVRMLCSMPEAVLAAQSCAGVASEKGSDDMHSPQRPALLEQDVGEMDQDETLVAAPDDDSHVQMATGAGELLLALHEEVLDRFLNLGVVDMADALWNLAGAGLADGRLQKKVADRVVEDASDWSQRYLDPTLWQVVCAFAKSRSPDLRLLKVIARLALREELDTLTNWAVAVMSWSFSELESKQDGLADFRRHLDNELDLRGLTEEQVALSPLGLEAGGDQALAALWRQRRTSGKKLPFIAPRPVKLLRRVAVESDAKLAAAVKELEREERTWDREDEDLLVSLEDFNLFDTPDDSALSSSG